MLNKTAMVPSLMDLPFPSPQIPFQDVLSQPSVELRSLGPTVQVQILARALTSCMNYTSYSTSLCLSFLFCKWG